MTKVDNRGQIVHLKIFVYIRINKTSLEISEISLFLEIIHITYTE